MSENICKVHMDVKHVSTDILESVLKDKYEEISNLRGDTEIIENELSSRMKD